MGGMTLKEAVEEYKNVLLPARNFSSRTRVEYINDVEDLVSFLERSGVSRVREISLPGVDRYLADLDQRGIAGTTRKRKVVVARSFLKFLYEDGYLSTNLSARVIPPKADFKNPRFLTEAEYNRLLAACSQHPRDFAIIQLLLQTGIKLSELNRLTVEDIELPDELFMDLKEGGHMHISGSERQKERVIPLNHKAYEALNGYLKTRPRTSNPALFINRFGEALTQRGVEKTLSKYFERAGINGASVQSLRHTFGAHHAAKGTSIKTLKEIMGLKDTESTSVYQSLAQEIIKRELQENAL
jgi:site-specific recombinase XerD